MEEGRGTEFEKKRLGWRKGRKRRGRKCFWKKEEVRRRRIGWKEGAEQNLKNKRLGGGGGGEAVGKREEQNLRKEEVRKRRRRRSGWKEESNRIWKNKRLGRERGKAAGRRGGTEFGK